MPELTLHDTPSDSVLRNAWHKLFGKKPALLAVISIVSALVLLVVTLVVMLAFRAPLVTNEEADKVPMRHHCVLTRSNRSLPGPRRPMLTGRKNRSKRKPALRSREEVLLNWVAILSICRHSLSMWNAPLSE